MKNIDFEFKVGMVADMIAGSTRIVVFTGAGVSTESGIPDFRSPGGIWTRFDPEEFTIDRFLGSPETRRKTWELLGGSGLITDAEPNPAHYAICELEKAGRLACVITQNIDNLHQKAGCPPEKVFELHGNMKRARCLSCGKRFGMDTIKKWLKSGVHVPECDQCSGILKPDVVYFGEALPREALDKATYHSRHCDLFIVIGSSLSVYPAAYMPTYALESGAKLVIINATRTFCDDQAEVVINGMAGLTMERILQDAKRKMKTGKGE
jgi:NAD-dependent deacetylase